MKKTKCLMFFICCYTTLIAQETEDENKNAFLKRIFLPSIDVGYQVPNSDLIEGSLKLATSIEYRFQNNNDFFIRVNYDTYSARYNLNTANITSNTLSGTVQMSDVFLGPGYRIGDKTFRVMFALMPGIKFYEFPTAVLNGTDIQIKQKGRSLFSTSALSTLEYYFDEKSAFTLSVYQNQVWESKDFWKNGGSAVGFSIGFITSLL